MAPSSWQRGLILGLATSKDLRCLKSYRGISLLSVAYKAFWTLLNNWLTAWLEDESVFHEAKNGFRKGRSCLEHILLSPV